MSASRHTPLDRVSAAVCDCKGKKNINNPFFFPYKFHHPLPLSASHHAALARKAGFQACAYHSDPSRRVITATPPLL